MFHGIAVHNMLKSSGSLGTKLTCTYHTLAETLMKIITLPHNIEEYLRDTASLCGDLLYHITSTHALYPPVP